MATTSLYLDSRSVRKDGLVPVKIIIRNRGGAAHIPTGINIPAACWQDGKVVNTRTAKVDKPTVLNAQLAKQLSEITVAVNAICGPKSNMSATVIKAKVLAHLYGVSEEARANDITLAECWEEYLANCRPTSVSTLAAPRAFVQKYLRKDYNLPFCELDEGWVGRLSTALKKSDLAANTKHNYFAMVKSMWRWGRKKRYTTREDIFEGHGFSQVATRSRALSIEEVREIWNFTPNAKTQCAWEKQVCAIDMFKLIFCLCGINMADLHDLTEDDVRSGRLETDRRKTGVHINIKLEPEAQEIIERYKRGGYLIGKLRRSSDRALSVTVNNWLNTLRPGLTIYWIRHTWASLAVELDIPDRVVFMGLAHRQGKLSDETYITMRNKKLDEANRKIIDYVLGKIEPKT